MNRLKKLLLSIKLSWLSGFHILSYKQVLKYKLVHICNVYGDAINLLNCRSLWTNNKGLFFRCEDLFIDTQTKREEWTKTLNTILKS